MVAFAVASPTSTFTAQCNITPRCENSPLRWRTIWTRSSRAPDLGIIQCSTSSSQTPSTVSFRSLFPTVDDGVVFNNKGEQLNLIDAVESAEKAVLIGWLRHYGCTLCMKQAQEWRTWLKTSSSTPDVKVVLIGSGPVEQVTPFQQELQWDECEVLTDPSRTTYGALEFRKDIVALINRSSLFATLGSFKKGFRQRWSVIPTDPLQQGGVVITDRDANVVCIRPDKYAGDHASQDFLMEQIRDV